MPGNNSGKKCAEDATGSPIASIKPWAQLHAAGAPESESRAGDHRDRHATLATGISFTSQLANIPETGGTDVWPAR